MHPTILIIRPEEAAIRFEQELRARFGSNLRIVRSPVMRMEFLTPKVDWAVIKTLIFTSHVAVQAFAVLTDNREFECYAVGSATAKAAREIGLDPIDCDGTAVDLVETIRAAKPTLPALYLRGEHVSDDVVGTLGQFDVIIQDVIVYRQRAELLSAEADALLQGDEPVILPLMSARSSRLLFNQVQPTAPMFMAAISENVAATVPDAFSSTLRTALKPKADAILDEVAKQIRDVKRLEGL